MSTQTNWGASQISSPEYKAAQEQRNQLWRQLLETAALNQQPMILVGKGCKKPPKPPKR